MPLITAWRLQRAHISLARCKLLDHECWTEAEIEESHRMPDGVTGIHAGSEAWRGDLGKHGSHVEVKSSWRGSESEAVVVVMVTKGGA